MTARAHALDWKEIGTLFFVMIGIVFFWNSIVLYPLKILVVFFHELSHAAATLATGGRVVEIRLEGNQSGRTFSQGGSFFAIASAGYLGSLLIGGAILKLSTKKSWSPVLNAILGLALLAATVIWVRPLASFGFIFGILTGVALVLAGNYLFAALNTFILKTIGLTSCLYAVLDIKGDILDRPTASSDALLLAQGTGIPAIVWGALWFVIAVAGATYCVFQTCRKTPARIRA